MITDGPSIDDHGPKTYENTILRHPLLPEKYSGTQGESHLPLQSTAELLSPPL